MNNIKVLLVSPKIEGDVVDSCFPLGLAYLSSILKKNGFNDIKAIDYSIETNVEIKNKIDKWTPDFIGVTMMISSFPDGKKKIGYLKKRFSNSKFFVGGIAAATIPEEILAIKGVDGIYRGEGEGIIVELVKRSVSGGNWKKIKGMSYFNNGKIISNPLADFINNLDKIPFSDRTLVSLKHNLQHIHGTKRKAMTLITSRGCPYQCVFCYRGPGSGKKFRPRSSQNIFREMEMLEKKYKINAFMFWDDNFLVDRKRILDLCRLLKNKDYHWKCQLRVDSIDEYLLKTMKKAGCVGVNIGVESGNEKILKLMKKGITKDEVRKAISICRKYEIFSNIYFILGLPWDTLESMEESVEFAIELNPNKAHFFIATPYPGTELRNISIKMGLKINDSWKDYLLKKTQACFIENKNYSKKDLYRISSRANKLFNAHNSF